MWLNNEKRNKFKIEIRIKKKGWWSINAKMNVIWKNFFINFPLKNIKN